MEFKCGHFVQKNGQKSQIFGQFYICWLHNVYCGYIVEGV